MDLVLLAGRLLLAVVFIVAGIAKLADPNGSRQAMRDFGVLARLVTAVAIALPVTELVIVIALIPRVSAWWGALGALVLLLLFVAGIGYQPHRGRTPDCHCFGQLHSAPVGWLTLARSGILAIIAAVVLVAGRDDPGRSAVAWIGNLTAFEVVTLIVIVLDTAVVAGLIWTVIHLIAQHGRLLLRIDALEAAPQLGSDPVAPRSVNGQTQLQRGLPIGTTAPAFTLPGLHGETMTLDVLWTSGRPVLLIFSDPDCGPCNALLPDVSRWQREHGAVLTIALISRGSVATNRPKANEHGIGTVLLQQKDEVANAYQAYGTPSAVLIRPDGTIGSPLVVGAKTIRTFVTTITAVESASVTRSL